MAVKCFTVIQDDGDFIQAIAVRKEYCAAVATAFIRASEIYDGQDVTFSPVFDTEGETGLGFHVYRDGKIAGNFFILPVEEGDDVTGTVPNEL